ncbi:MAG: helix-turn-helix domain-containing protein [Lachnospiraceae bacterium]
MTVKSNGNYLGTLIKNERRKKKLRMSQIYSGICSEAAYARFEKGDFDMNIHVRGMLMQRLGINETRSGMYVNAREYEELDLREHILESIGSGQPEAARVQLDRYKSTYNMKNKLNRQFVDYVEARLAYVEGDKAKSLKLYENALEYTIPDYEHDPRSCFECISVYEAYIACEIAGISAQLGKSERAERIYTRLISCCRKRSMDKWIKCRIYPKAVCGLLRIKKLETTHRKELEHLFHICDEAVESLRASDKLYFLVELLKFRSKLCGLLGIDEQKEYTELKNCLIDLYSEYGIQAHRYQWYPYYINGIYYPVEKFINERRIMNGMTVEELAGTELDVGTVSRIINGKHMPRQKTLDILFRNLGVEGAQYSETIISEDAAVHELWEEYVDAMFVGNYAEGEELYLQLKEKLDISNKINCMVLDCMRTELDRIQGRADCRTTKEKYEKIMQFTSENMTKYKYCVIIEQEIIAGYIDCINKLNMDECVEILRGIYENYAGDIVERKRLIKTLELVFSRYSSYLGTYGHYELSNQIAHEGIKMELECARTYILSGLLYDIAWNHAQEEKLSDDDIKLCRYAYLIAWFQNKDAKMKFFIDEMKKWQ